LAISNSAYPAKIFV